MRFSALRRSSSCTSSTGERPNLDFSPPLLAHRPDPSLESLMRTPTLGSTCISLGHLEQHVELVQLLDDDDAPYGPASGP